MLQVKAVPRLSSPLRALAWIGVLSFAAILYYVGFVSGPQMQAEYRQRVEVQIRDEDRRFCEAFDLKEGTASRSRCESELAIIRANQVARTLASQWAPL
jgi:hypothetical protein